MSHDQNAGVGHGKGSPVRAKTAAKNRIENGKPNRKRILVAPQVPSGPVNCRCIALRATCPIAAVMVKGIQSEAMLNMMSDDRSMGARFAGTVEVAGAMVNRNGVMTGLRVHARSPLRGGVTASYAPSATTM